MNGRPIHALQKTKHLVTKLLQQYAATKSLASAKQLHAFIITSGSLFTHFHSTLIAWYGNCGHVSNARKLFDEMSVRSSFLYTTMMKVYSQNGSSCDALKLFVEMVRLGEYNPDNFAYPIVIKACSDLTLRELGIGLHGKVFVTGFDIDTFVANCLISMYMNLGDVKAARMVFDAMWVRSVVSWNTVISGYFRNGYAMEASVVFDWMVTSGVEPDCASVVSVLPACGYLGKVEMGRRVHQLVESRPLAMNIAAWNALVDMYVKCGSVNEARLVFDRMSVRDIVSWTSMINGYILNGDVTNALRLFRLMHSEGIRPNSLTVTSLLSGCSSLDYLKDGQSLHGWTIRQKLDSEVVVETALIDMYAKCNRVKHSFQVFERTSKKRTIPWNAILAGCIHNGLATEAIELFRQMQKEVVEPNDATFNSLLPAFSVLADLQQAMNIHCYLTKSGFLSGIEVATGLIDVYFKCGSLESAHRIFSGIPEKVKDIVVWSVIIAGYGMHGHGEIAVSLFKQMILSSVKPNEVTFTSALHACGHAGLVDEGLDIFKLMLKNDQISPRADHYSCIVDLLGRAGRLDEAYDMIRTMPFQPTHALWGALLGACVIHEHVELGEVAAKWLFDLEPENPGNYVLLAKIYAAIGRWKDAENVRDMMNEIGLRKEPAHSLVEVRNI